MFTLLAVPFVADGSVAAQTVECQNRAFLGATSHLPDCGAYEKVSPQFKDGSAIQGADAIAPSGDEVIVSAVGSFAGVQSNLLGARYSAVRTNNGWTTMALNPPASEFTADVKWFATSTDLTTTLWGLRKPNQPTPARDVYLRRHDGEFVKVGPTTPPSTEGGPPAGSEQEFDSVYLLAGVSDDLSHIVFEAPGIGVLSTPWPGDTTRTGGTSLYQYVGTGNVRPALVGVSDGNTLVNGKRRAPDALISTCATFFGSRFSEDTYNAISREGGTVFFTAAGKAGSSAFGEPCAEEEETPPVDELYARINDLETVAISEPTSADCSSCQTAARANATFQGASEDGTKVFFLTEQELLSGSEGLNLYEYDFANRAGKKIVRVSTGSPKPEVLGVSRVSENGSHVYFVARGALTGANREGDEPVEGQPNLYVFERDDLFPAGRLAFVGTLSAADERDWANSDDRLVQATPDGRYMTFASVADLTPGDTSTVQQIFEYDAQAEVLARASVGEAGYAEGQVSADEHRARIGTQEFSVFGFRPTTSQKNLAISPDGSAVLFESAGALTPQALEASEVGAESVYEYRSSGSIANGDTFLISDGRNKLTPQGNPASLTPDGQNVFFLSIDQILPQDGDQQFDMYDARSGGGFSVPARPFSCTGEGCEGTPSVQPPFGSAASLGVAGVSSLPFPPPPPHQETGKPKTKAKTPTRAQRLAKALKACKRKKRKRRTSCKKQVRKRYGAKKSASRPLAKGEHHS